jgi:hypothetical protein
MSQNAPSSEKARPSNKASMFDGEWASAVTDI